MTFLLQSSIKLVALWHSTVYITLNITDHILKLCYTAFRNSQVWAVGRLPFNYQQYTSQH